MKKMFAVLLLVCMVFTLCACDNGAAANTNETQATPATTQPTEPQNTQTTAPNTTTPAETEPVATEPVQTGPTYIIKLVDEGGNPVVGAFVQLCGDVCIPKMTDENGVATYEDQELRSDYKASVTVYPEGYEAASEQTDYYFEDSFEVTIVVKAVA